MTQRTKKEFCIKSKIQRYAKETITFFIVMTIFANVVSLYKSGDLNKAPFTLQNLVLLDESPFKVQKDKALLVHFWATWCPTCKVEAPNIQSVSNDFQVLTIAVKSGSNEEIKRYLNERDLNFRVVNDYSGLLAKELQIAAFPTTFVYDKNGKLVFSDVGYTSTWGLWLRLWWASF